MKTQQICSVNCSPLKDIVKLIEDIGVKEGFHVEHISISWMQVGAENLGIGIIIFEREQIDENQYATNDR